MHARRPALLPFLLPLLFMGGPPAEATPPNILFVYSDDHSRMAISAYGSKVNQTPHLDRLSRQGARFANSFVTNSICTPARATILTGQYSHINGVPVFNSFDGATDHVAKQLGRAGYHTAVLGKWHLGSDPTGFDQWSVLPNQGDYVDPKFRTPEGTYSVKGHVTGIITEMGLSFLRSRPKDRPFFLMLQHKAPHREWTPDPVNREKFRNTVFPEPPTLFDDYATRPAALPWNTQTITRDLAPVDLKVQPPPDLSGKELVRWKYQRYMQDYIACVQGVDDSVGRILDELDKQGLAENTVVIYTSDNGWFLGEHGLYDKRFMYEPGLRVPLIVRGPGVKAGAVPGEFVVDIDMAPTFLELAGVPVPDSMQGRSLVPLLKGAQPEDWRDSIYYRYYHDPGDHRTRAHYGVRTATHKLIHYWTQDAWEMFDLRKDPNEQHNMLFHPTEAADPAVSRLFEELKAELTRLQEQYADTGRYHDLKVVPPHSVGRLAWIPEKGVTDVPGLMRAAAAGQGKQ